jgi:predicted CxxxxCH...CXXCH cytochrome family protein
MEEGSTSFRDPASHINGVVDVVGAGATGGCTSCHGSATSSAPPKDLAGNTAATGRGVGAHEAHLKTPTWHRAIPCASCHRVPTTVDAPGHRDGDNVAEVIFDTLNPGANYAAGTCSNLYCHGTGRAGNGTASWTTPGALACGTCHRLDGTGHVGRSPPPHRGREHAVLAVPRRRGRREPQHHQREPARQRPPRGQDGERHVQRDDAAVHEHRLPRHRDLVMKRSLSTLRASLLGSLLAVGACAYGDPSGASCPTDDAPTYASFGQQFFATYCTSCHSASSTNRHGAPGGQNYDTEADVIRHADDIDEAAARGPDAKNTFMPELGGTVTHKPSDAEREMLGQYLACVRR